MLVALLVATAIVSIIPQRVSAQYYSLPSGSGVGQTIVELDLTSAGSAQVIFTLFITNFNSSLMDSFNMTFSQTVFNLFIHDMITGRGENYNIIGTGNDTYTVGVHLDPPLEQGQSTIIQLTYHQAGLARLSDPIQGLWALELAFPKTHNFRFYVKLPPATDPTSVQFPKQGFNVQYLDSDNRWVIELVAAQIQQSSLTIQYRASTKLWGYFLVAVLSLFVGALVLLRLRGNGTRHARDVRDRGGAYGLWQMSLAIHLAVLAIVGGSWGLLITQEPSFPSLIDGFLGILLLLTAVFFVADTYYFERFIRAI